MARCPFYRDLSHAIRTIQLSVFLGIFAQGSRAQLAPTVKRPQSENRNYGRIECLWSYNKVYHIIPKFPTFSRRLSEPLNFWFFGHFHRSIANRENLKKSRNTQANKPYGTKERCFSVSVRLGDLVWGETKSVAPERMRVWHPRITCGLAGQCITFRTYHLWGQARLEISPAER